MRRQHYIGIVSLVVVGGLLTDGALVVGYSYVPAQVIASSVTHTGAYRAGLATASGRYVPREA